MNMSRIFKIPTVMACWLWLGGCAHPYLKAGETLGSAIQKANAPIKHLIEAEASTYRTYSYVSQASNALGELDSDFIGLACRGFAETMITESVASNNLEQFSTMLIANAADPKDATLATFIAALAADAAVFDEKSANNAAEKFKRDRRDKAIACAVDVRATFSAKPHAGAAAIPVALAAWPKIREVLAALLSEAAKSKRENAIRDALTDPETTTLLRKSIDAITASMERGDLGQTLLAAKQIALWDAYSEFLTVKALKPSSAADIDSFKKISASAHALSKHLSAYDALQESDLREGLKKTAGALKKLQSLAHSKNSPDSALLAELFATLDFLSDVSAKFDAAEKAL